MHPRHLAERTQAAQQRIEAAASALGAKHGAPANVSVYDRDPATRALLRQEAVADLLEALAEGGKREVPQPDPVTGERPGDIGFKQPASATPQRTAGAGGGEPPAPAPAAKRGGKR